MRTQGTLQALKTLAITIAAVGLFLTTQLGFAAQVELENNFESKLKMNCSGNCPTVSKKHAREGSSSMRSFIDRKKSKNSYRAEAVIPGNAKKMEFDEDYWYGFSVYLPQDWEVSGRNEVIAQFHSTLDPGDKANGPPMSIRAGTGNWEIVNRAEGDKRAGGKVWTLNSVWEDVGKWTDWVIHYKPSYGNKGVLRIWKDGSLVVQRYGKNTYQDRVGPYFKMGLYMNWKKRNCCDPGVRAKTVYHDALRIASGPRAGYFDVAPRGGASSGTSTAKNVSNKRSSKASAANQAAASEKQSSSSGSGSPKQSSPGKDSVEISNLRSRQRVSGKVRVTVDAYDRQGIRQVLLQVGDDRSGKVVGKKSKAPWNFTLNTNRYRSGSTLRLKAIMRDKKGNTRSDVIRVKVD